MLASSVQYTDVLIRRHLYPQTMYRRPPFVIGYDVVGEIDQLGDGMLTECDCRSRVRRRERLIEFDCWKNFLAF